MKIRQRLAIRFTIVSALVTGTILILIYFFTRGFVQSDFAERLTQQSSLEVLHFASPQVKDVIPEGAFNLVNPSTSIYSTDKELLYKKGDYNIPKTWINFLKDNNVFNAERGPYTIVGRKHFINGQLYLVFVSDKDLPGEREMVFLTQASIVGWIVSLILLYLTGLYFSTDAIRPVTQVVYEVNKITEQNLSHRLAINKDQSSKDEIDELIITFNELLDRIQKAFIAQKRFVQNASHEIKTPLTAIMAEVELALARSRTIEEYKRTLNIVLQESERLAHITQGLLTLARLEEGSQRIEMETLQIKQLFTETLNAFRLHHPEREVVMDGELQDEFIQGNAHLLQTTFLNILDNAYKYSADKIIIHLHREKNQIIITIQDFGIGIPKGEQAKIKTTLYRATNAVTLPGAGLGLSLVDRIVSVHNGKFEIESEEGKGTTCKIKLPLDHKNLTVQP